MKGLTKRQKQILEFISNYIKKNNMSPSIREIAEKFKFSPKAAYDHLDALIKKEYITMKEHTARSIQLTKKNGIPILGTVKAGIPVLAEENFEGYVELPQVSGDKFFGLRVKGDSMIEAGIYEDDIVIVKKTSSAEPNDIVVAILDNEITVKRLKKERNKFVLIPENSNYQKIIDPFEILGKVVFLMRIYEK